MHELEDVQEYIDDKFSGLYDEDRVEYLYKKISNPHLRVKTRDELWVAYITQASEDTTAVNAIRKILNIDDFDWRLKEKERVEKIIDEVGDQFALLRITHKTRIPFYILVLDELIPIKPKATLKSILEDW